MAYCVENLLPSVYTHSTFTSLCSIMLNFDSVFLELKDAVDASRMAGNEEGQTGRLNRKSFRSIEQVRVRECIG